MKELAFNTGGRPLFNNDLETFQGETLESFSAILRGLGKPVIVSGCQLRQAIVDEISVTDSYTLDEGIVYIDGKILRLEAFTGFQETGDLTPPPNFELISTNGQVTPAYYIVREINTNKVIDRRTHKDGIEKPAILEERAIIVKEPIDGQEFIQIKPDSSFDTFWKDSFSRLTRFIESLTGGSDKVILNGFEVTISNENVVTNTGGSIYYQGEIYTVLNRGISNLIDANPRLRIVSVADRRMELVSSNDAESVFAESELIRFEDVRRNVSFPKGTVLNVKMNASEVEENFDTGGDENGLKKGKSPVWKGWIIDPDAEGRVIVGYDQGSSRFNNLKSTGGSTDITLTERQMPRHNHGLTLSADSDTHTHTIRTRQDDFNVSGGAGPSYGGDNGTFRNTNTTESDTHSHTITGSMTSEGSSQSHENMPPYVVYLTVVKIEI